MTSASPSANPTSPRRTRIVNARIFDGSGSAPFFGEILVAGDRIEAVSRTGGVFADADTIDAGGAFLMPGLVECHTHITYPNAYDRWYPHLYPPAAVETTLMTVHNAQVLIDHGFTSAYSAGAIKPGIETHVRDEIAAGRIAGRAYALRRWSSISRAIPMRDRCRRLRTSYERPCAKVQRKASTS